MAAKGARTRQHIVEQAATEFNRRGDRATTLGDLMAATGLEKGGLYNHFGSKDELALAAYEHNVAIISAQLTTAIRAAGGAVDRLVAFLGVFRRFVHDPPFPGGCPTLNTAVESHGSQDPLHGRARQALEDLQSTVGLLVSRGVAAGELRPDTDPEATAAVVVAAVEGGLLLAAALDDPNRIEPVIDHLERHVRSLAASQEAP